jgi:hypothetical protein
LSIVAALTLLVLTGIGVTGYFRQTSETAALRKAAASSLPGGCNKKVALNVGWFTTACIRKGSQFVNMPPEALAAMNSMRSVDFGVYELNHEPSEESLAQLFNRADAAMKLRGWDRIVGVRDNGTMVAVYFPKKSVPFSKVRFSAIVVDGRDMVVASASANLDPLVDFAHDRMGTNLLANAIKNAPVHPSLIAAHR